MHLIPWTAACVRRLPRPLSLPPFLPPPIYSCTTRTHILTFTHTPPKQGPPDSLLRLLDRHASPQANDHKPVGFLLFTSYSHALPLPEAAALEANASVHLPLNDTDDRIHWVGHRFAETREDGHDDGYQKSLLSARHIYFTGFHLPGACTARANPERDWGKLLRDDDPEFAAYAKKVGKEEAAVMHFRVVLKPITYVRSKVMGIWVWVFGWWMGRDWVDTYRGGRRRGGAGDWPTHTHNTPTNPYPNKMNTHTYQNTHTQRKAPTNPYPKQNKHTQHTK